MAFDVITPTKLGQESLTVSTSTVYTVPNFVRTIVKTIDITNTNNIPVIVTLYLVASGGTPATTNILLSSISIDRNGVFQWTGAPVLNTGDTIQAFSSLSNVNIYISGGECT